MRIWIVSDLHLNHASWPLARVPEHDVMIIAGDIADGIAPALEHLGRLAERTGRTIVFVPGNHDVFEGRLDGFAPQLDGPVYVLPAGESVIIGDVRFVGATLWSDFLLFDTEFASQAWAARHMPEYRFVRKADGSDRIWPRDTAAAHDAHRFAIERQLWQRHDGPTVVVTHHAPSPRSIPWPIDVEDASWASELEQVMLEHGPDLWVHGHVHRAADYHCGHTRVVANPRGYPHEETGWDEALVIEVK